VPIRIMLRRKALLASAQLRVMRITSWGDPNHGRESEKGSKCELTDRSVRSELVEETNDEDG